MIIPAFSGPRLLADIEIIVDYSRRNYQDLDIGYFSVDCVKTF